MREAFSLLALESGFDAGTWVEVVAHGVSDEVEREDSEHDGSSGKQDEVRGVEKVGAGVVQHASPTGNRRRNTETEKAHGGFGEDGRSHADGGLDDDRLHDVGENVADEDSPIAGSESTGGFDVFALAGGEDLGADKASVSDPASNDQGKYEIPEAGTEEGNEGDGEEDSGKRKECVHHDDVDEAVEAAPEVSGEGADKCAEEERSGDNRGANDHGDSGAVENAREDVAAEFVGSEEVLRGGRLEARCEVDGRGITRRDRGAEGGAEEKEDDEKSSEDRQRVAGEDAGVAGADIRQVSSLGTKDKCRSKCLRGEVGCFPTFAKGRQIWGTRQSFLIISVG